jgi:hypothetical protein
LEIFSDNRWWRFYSERKHRQNHAERGWTSLGRKAAPKRICQGLIVLIVSFQDQALDDRRALTVPFYWETRKQRFSWATVRHHWPESLWEMEDSDLPNQTFKSCMSWASNDISKIIV